MYQRTKIAVAVTLAISSMTAYAQDAAPALQRVEVTGSRIRQIDLETAQPVMTMNAEQIQKTGLVTVGDILNNLSSVGSPVFSKGAVLTSNTRNGRRLHQHASTSAHSAPAGAGQRQALDPDRGRLHRHVDHPGVDDRAPGDPERRRIVDLRFRRDRRRGQHHPEEGHARRRSHASTAARTKGRRQGGRLLRILRRRRRQGIADVRPVAQQARRHLGTRPRHHRASPTVPTIQPRPSAPVHGAVSARSSRNRRSDRLQPDPEPHRHL